MSTFSVTVVKIPKVGKHPNADTLSICHVEGCPVVFRTTDFKEGDIAVYIPIDAIVPLDKPCFAFLNTDDRKTHARIKAKKLRGIFSMGLLLKFDTVDINPEVLVGTNIAESLGVTKYEEPVPVHMNTGNEKDPGFMPVYDMESYRKYKHLLNIGEQVVVSEKVHGFNGRFCFKDNRLWVGSHRCIKKEDANNAWWRIAKQEDLLNKLNLFPGLILYGEVYGTQDLKYENKNGELKFAAFDIFDSNNGRFLDFDVFEKICKELAIPIVPILHIGEFKPEFIEPFSTGSSTLANHIKEGIVIKPVKERWNHETGRTILKLVGEQYLLRNNGTEFH